MIFVTHHFRSHVTWSSTRIMGVVLLPLSGDSEISDSDIAIRFHDQIFWFDISVDNFIGVQIVQSQYDAGDEELSFVLVEPPTDSDVVPKVAPVQEVHDQVEVLFVLKRIRHIYYEWML